MNWEKDHKFYWDQIASYYDSFYSNPWSYAEDQETRELLSSLISNRDMVILDLACGTGLGYSLCVSLCRDVKYIGLDISSEMINIGKKNYPGLIADVGSMDDLSRFDSDIFDMVIILYSSFSFTDKPNITLSEIYRVLKPGGCIFISSLNRFSLRRLIRAKTRRYERYYTRNQGIRQISIPSWTYTRSDLVKYLKKAGFRDLVIIGQGYLSGVIEIGVFWKINIALSRLFPDLCHILNVMANKPNQ